MSRRRRRPHPARRARRVAGATAISAYAGLLVSVGWGQRAAENDATPAPAPDDITTTAPAVERLDLRGTATFVPSVTTGPTVTTRATVPLPPPPPTVAVTTTIRTRTTTAPAATSTTPPATAEAPPVDVAPSTTVAAPTSTLPPPTAPPPTALPPPTTVPTGAS